MRNPFTKNVALSAPKWYVVASNGASVEKLRSLFKWEFCALLTQDEVLRGMYYSKKLGWVVPWLPSPMVNGKIFSLIADKKTVIRENIENFKTQISVYWFYESFYSQELLKYYLEKWYITHQDLKIWVENYFSNRANIIFIKMSNMKHTQKLCSWNERQYYLYFYKPEQNILAYMMRKKFYSPLQYEFIVRILKENGEDEESFLEKYGYDDYVSIYIKSYLLS